MEYPKIHSLWKRQGWYFDENCKKNPDKQAGRQSFIIGDYAEPEFGNIRHWRVDEKIDGMNIRVYFNRRDARDRLQFMGRTNNAQMPPSVLECLKTLFVDEKLEEVFAEKNPAQVTFYGECYGPKINSGGYYAKETGFVLFDIKIGAWWLGRHDVIGVASQLGLACTPQIGIMDEESIVDYIKAQPLSLFAKVEPHIMEGVVCRSEPLMLFRRGEPIMFKLKCKEFVNGK